MEVRPPPDISGDEDDTTMHDPQPRTTIFARTLAEVLAELPGEEDIDASDAQTISREEALDRLHHPNAIDTLRFTVIVPVSDALRPRARRQRKDAHFPRA
jgi:hypothetical protein